MPSVTISIPIVPVGQRRARACVRGKHAMVYKSKEQRTQDDNLRSYIMQHLPAGTPLVGPIKLCVRSYLPVPASWSQKKRALALCGGIMPTGKPDASNLAKMIEDVANGVLFLDDKQITDLHVVKRYSSSPGWIITITWGDEMENEDG